MKRFWAGFGAGFLMAGALFLWLRLWVWEGGPASEPAPPPALAPPAVSSRPRPAPFLFPPGRGKIAIVLDDWGYNRKRLGFLAEIGRPLTVAVLPGRPYSEAVARAAHEHGHEVILHMPMEAVGAGVSEEPETLRTAMADGQVLSMIERALLSVPHARGLSNHQGSKATADRTLMRRVLLEVKRRRLYFLDSFVTPDSVCREVADSLRVRFTRRDVFLDNRLEADAIREQLAALARTAGRRGRAVGIGHDRSVTLAVLREAIPALEEAGYTLVPVSELLEGD